MWIWIFHGKLRVKTRSRFSNKCNTDPLDFLIKCLRYTFVENCLPTSATSTRWKMPLILWRLCRGTNAPRITHSRAVSCPTEVGPSSRSLIASQWVETFLRRKTHECLPRSDGTLAPFSCRRERYFCFFFSIFFYFFFFLSQARSRAMCFSGGALRVILPYNF